MKVKTTTISKWSSHPEVAKKCPVIPRWDLLNEVFEDARNDALEEAARIADEECERLGGVNNPKDALIARKIANEIRGLRQALRDK